MKFNGKHYTSLWFEKGSVKIIDQTVLPEEFRILELKSSDQIIDAIKTMKVRGAPLIGVTGAYGVYFAFNPANLF